MIVKKYRRMTNKEIFEELAKARQDLVEIKFNLRMGKEKDYSQIKQLKRNIARMLTVINERGLDSKPNLFDSKSKTKESKELLEVGKLKAKRKGENIKKEKIKDDKKVKKEVRNVKQKSVRKEEVDKGKNKVKKEVNLV